MQTDEVTPLSRHPNDPARAASPGATQFLTTVTVTIAGGTAAQTAEDTEAREAERAHEIKPSEDGTVLTSGCSCHATLVAQVSRSQRPVVVCGAGPWRLALLSRAVAGTRPVIRVPWPNTCPHWRRGYAPQWRPSSCTSLAASTVPRPVARS